MRHLGLPVALGGTVGMTIHRTITPTGDFLYFRARTQRGNSSQYIYDLDLEAIKKKVIAYWDSRPGQNINRCFEITDRILWGVRAIAHARSLAEDRMEQDKPQATKAVEINGCRIVASKGRCKPAWECGHYEDCLDLAMSKNWYGWQTVGR